MPAESLLECVMHCEGIFRDMNGNELNLEKNLIEKMSARAHKVISSIPKEVILCFMKTRFFIRLRELNKKLGVQKSKLKTKFITHVSKFSEKL